MSHPNAILEKFNMESNNLYTKFSPYENSSNNNVVNFGSKQPYVYKKLTDVGKNNFGNTALMVAGDTGRTEIIRLLKEAGAKE